MNREEEIVFNYLTYKAYEEIQYEPNKQGNNRNIPPDFSIRGSIGIEVRRLNQHYITSAKTEPLEQVDFNLIPKINSLLKSYNKIDFDKSAFVMINFRRPINPNKNLLRKLKQALDDHLDSLDTSKTLYFKNLKLEMLPASTVLESAYHLGAIVDADSGGGVVSNIYKNLEVIINEKQTKVNPQLEKFDSWWLILVDYISYGLTSYDLQQLNSLPPFEHSFDKVILLSPLDLTHAVEVEL
ncbi:hypothetical protein H8S95_10895 [Pontibacter sp. KCTC 32443]|uniref:hypothetical protein n=1 Tax=Pontibacter TaxID=323449 RepID=UPI00164E916C|nr:MULTISPECIES: hypothetical protein [Pontibacter]MBC5774568.1 hypothetical protein [Pontibacter sp. KCTC 32443]